MIDRSTPRVPLVLGLGGLVPFGVLAILILTGWHDALGWSGAAVRSALLTYGAAIASFLGGIRWGLALGRKGSEAARDYALSVVPSLFGWASLMLPGRAAFATLGSLIILWGIVDQDVVRRGLAPIWFGQLRAILSTGAGSALLAVSLV